MPASTRLQFTQKCVDLLDQLNALKQQGLPIVYLDETLFGKRSIVSREWSSKNSNLTVSQEEQCTGYRNVIASMTEEEGILYPHLQESPCDSHDFIKYLYVLQRKMNFKPFALFMDNAPIHTAKVVKPYYADLEITPVFNVGYSPEFNPIEAVFSKVKRLFIHERLNNLVNKTGFNFDRTIKKSFRSINADHCGACVRKSLFLLQKAA